MEYLFTINFPKLARRLSKKKNLGERPMQGLSIDILGLKIYNGDPSISAINQEKQLTDIRTFRNVL